MQYQDEYGNAFELPKLTVALSEEIHEAAKQRPVRESAAAQLAVCLKCLPEDYVEEAADGATLDTLDVAKLAALFHAVKAAYEAPAAAIAMESAKSQLEAVAPLIEAYRALQGVPQQKSRQGFTRVR